MASTTPKGFLRFLPIPLLLLAGFVLWRELHGLDLNAVRHAMVQWGPGRSLASLAMAFTVYGLLAGNEQVALRWAHAYVPIRIGMRNAFIAFALANTLGFGFLVGGAFRANAYRRFGVGLGKVAQITAYGTLTFFLGVLTLAGGLLLHAHDDVYAQIRVGSVVGVEPFVGRAIGGLMWVGLALYATAGALAPDRLRLFKFEFKPPRPGLVAVQVFFGCADLMAGACVFWLLLGTGAPHYSDFLSAYIIAIVVGLLSGVPGGAGVFESVMVGLLPGVDLAVLTAAFLGFRIFYYFAPLAVALVLIAFMKHTHDPDVEPGPKDD